MAFDSSNHFSGCRTERKDSNNIWKQPTQRKRTVVIAVFTSK